MVDARRQGAGATARGKRLVVVTALCGLGVLAGAVVALWRPAFEWWQLGRLESSETAVREAAAESLSAMGVAAAIPRILDWVGEATAGHAAREEVWFIEPERLTSLAIPLHTTGLLGLSSEVWELGSLGDRRRLALAVPVSTEVNQYTRWLDAIVARSPAESAPHLARALEDERPHVRCLVGALLAKVGPAGSSATAAVIRALEKPGERLFGSVAIAAGGEGKLSLEGSDCAEASLATAIWALARVGTAPDRARPVLERLAESDDEFIARLAADALERLDRDG